MREIIKASYMQRASIGNIYRSVKVCVCTMPADLTLENCLAATIRFCDMATDRALFAGVSRIDSNTGNTGALGLVFDLDAKVCERPVMQSVSVHLSGLNVRADSRQFFDGNTQTQAFGFRNY